MFALCLPCYRRTNFDLWIVHDNFSFVQVLKIYWKFIVRLRKKLHTLGPCGDIGSNQMYTNNHHIPTLHLLAHTPLSFQPMPCMYLGSTWAPMKVCICVSTLIIHKVLCISEINHRVRFASLFYETFMEQNYCYRVKQHIRTMKPFT